SEKSDCNGINATVQINSPILDFSATIFGPLQWFRVGDVIYVMTGSRVTIRSTGYLLTARRRSCSARADAAS
ncbi:hypothetical protein O5286_29195, partial [Escherichia coli]|nr:hypothetical protein [Escherichia coli]